MVAPPFLLAGSELQSVNPATLAPVGTVRAAAPEELSEQVAEAQLAHERWAQSAPDERRALLARLAEALLGRMDDVAATVTAETGKPLLEAYVADVLVALESVCWVAKHAARVLAPERLRFAQPFLRHKRAWTLYEPLGVVAVISPSNLPFSIPFAQTVAAVAAGNSVVLKPSELTPLSGEWVERLFREAAAPRGLVRVVQGTGESVGEALVRTHGVAKVFFTGSREAGRRVAVAAGERLRPVTLELGGKDAMLVLDDADLDRAVEGALWAAFSNCGQTCVGAERAYVERSLYEPFVEELARRAAGLRIGRGEELETELGPLVSEAGREHVEQLVVDALERGAEARTGAGRPALELPGWFYEPTVLTGVPPEASILREETFGPVVTVAPVADEDEGVKLANDSTFGLGASVWTSDLDRAARIARRLEAGSVWTNDTGYSFGAPQAPWGGRKDSGFGRTHARHGLLECAEPRFVDSDAGLRGVAWWYPYGPETVDGFRGALRVLYGSGLAPRAGALWRHRRGLLELGSRYLGR